ncbi:MAG: nucleoside hydrolase, partial [Fastidiosipila sp.]|nr:nucleoside hydrolase [Fastidiosipila sp.]
KLTRGKTVSDVYSDYKFDNRKVDVVLGLDHERFYNCFLEILQRH